LKELEAELQEEKDKEDLDLVDFAQQIEMNLKKAEQLDQTDMIKRVQQFRDRLKSITTGKKRTRTEMEETTTDSDGPPRKKPRIEEPPKTQTQTKTQSDHESGSDGELMFDDALFGEDWRSQDV